MMHRVVTAVEEGMEVDMEEARQDAGERFYCQDRQLTADSGDLAEVETQASNNPTRSNLTNFVPTDGSNVFPEIINAEKVHLLQR